MTEDPDGCHADVGLGEGGGTGDFRQGLGAP